MSTGIEDSPVMEWVKRQNEDLQGSLASALEAATKQGANKTAKQTPRES